MDATLFVLCLVGFICVMPMTLYCLGISYLNSRDRPLMVSGSWDFAAVLLSLSGFLILGGPLLLSLIDSVWRTVWFRGNFAQLRAAWETTNGLWIGIWAIYFFLVLIIIIASVYGRKAYTMIYQVDPRSFSDLIERTAAELGFACREQPGGWLLSTPTERFSLETQTVMWSRHVTLHWVETSPQTRLAFEEHFRRELPDLAPRTNPSSNILFSIACCLFFSLLFFLVFMGSFLFLGPA